MKKGLKIFIAVLLAVFFIFVLVARLDFSYGSEPIWGVTFSQFYAVEELGLVWQEVYKEILDDLDPKTLRLIAYWQYLEKERGKYNFHDLDWQVKEAQKRGKEIILVLGYRVPRWPECYAPVWANNLDKEDFRRELKNYISAVIGHYKQYPAIKIWQVENEPLADFFGDCPKSNKEFLKEEIVLVKSLDNERRIMVTDSGELSFWLGSAGLSDVFGTTLYRIVWNKYIGWFKHWYPPAFYAARAVLLKNFFQTKTVVISELQAEPWTADRKPLRDVTFKEQTERFGLDELKDNLEFAKKTGISEIYLWGVEWWYYRKIGGDDSYWQFGKETIKK